MAEMPLPVVKSKTNVFAQVIAPAEVILATKHLTMLLSVSLDCPQTRKVLEVKFDRRIHQAVSAPFIKLSAVELTTVPTELNLAIKASLPPTSVAPFE